MDRDADFWEAMYRAVTRRLREIAASDDDDQTIIADFKRLAPAHPLDGDTVDLDHAQLADRLEAESLQPTPPKQ